MGLARNTCYFFWP